MKRSVWGLMVAVASSSALAAGVTKSEITIDEAGIHVQTTTVTAPDILAFEDADADGDGWVDRQEARDKGILDFANVDLDGDGRLDREEYEVAVYEEGRPKDWRGGTAVERYTLPKPQQ